MYVLSSAGPRQRTHTATRHALTNIFCLIRHIVSIHQATGVLHADSLQGLGRDTASADVRHKGWRAV